MKKSTIILTMTIGAVLSISTIMPSQNASAIEKRPVHMDYACSKQYPNSKPVLIAQNVFGWRCRIFFSYGLADLSVDVSRACRDRYGGAYRAAWEVYNNPYNWYCYK